MYLTCCLRLAPAGAAHAAVGGVAVARLAAPLPLSLQIQDPVNIRKMAE